MISMLLKMATDWSTVHFGCLILFFGCFFSALIHQKYKNKRFYLALSKTTTFFSPLLLILWNHAYLVLVFDDQARKFLRAFSYFLRQLSLSQGGSILIPLGYSDDRWVQLIKKLLSLHSENRGFLCLLPSLSLIKGSSSSLCWYIVLSDSWWISIVDVPDIVIVSCCVYWLRRTCTLWIKLLVTCL